MCGAGSCPPPSEAALPHLSGENIEFCELFLPGWLVHHGLLHLEGEAALFNDPLGLGVVRVVAAPHGSQQIGARIAYNEMDMVLFFVDPNEPSLEKELLYISRLCDQNNIPFASNVATAEMLVLGMDRGDLDWRNIVNPKHKFNR